MRISDQTAYWINALEYQLGSSVARLLVNKVGNRSKLHWSIKYWSPSKICIGEGCEVRHGTFLDARSKSRIAIGIGDGSRIKDYVGLAAYGGEIHLGKNVLISRAVTIFGHGGVYIGDNSMIGPHSQILSTDHIAYLSDEPFQRQGFTREPIHIGQNVWIGANVCILAGSNVSAHVVVAAGAVVTGELKTGYIYGGIPAEPLKPLPRERPAHLKIYMRDWSLLS